MTRALVNVLLSALICLVAVAGIGVWRVTDAATVVVAGIPAQIRDTRLMIDARLASIQADTASVIRDQQDRIDRQVAAALAITDQRSGEAVALMRSVADDANRQLSQLNATANVQLSQANQTLAAAANQVTPLVTESRDTVADLHASFDANYDELHATVESATVAVAGAGRAMDEVAKSAPAVAGDFHRIADDAAREADSITKPQKWWQKILGPIYTIARLVGIFI